MISGSTSMPAATSGSASTRKVKATLHWVSARHAIGAALTVLLVLIPLFALILFSFREGSPWDPGALTLDNYREAWRVGEIPRHFWNTMFITIPALVLILLLSSMLAFACTRFSWKFNVFFLVLIGSGVGWAVRDRAARTVEAEKAAADKAAAFYALTNSVPNEQVLTLGTDDLARYAALN